MSLENKFKKDVTSFFDESRGNLLITWWEDCGIQTTPLGTPTLSIPGGGSTTAIEREVINRMQKDTLVMSASKSLTSVCHNFSKAFLTLWLIYTVTEGCPLVHELNYVFIILNPWKEKPDIETKSAYDPRYLRKAPKSYRH